MKKLVVLSLFFSSLVQGMKNDYLSDQKMLSPEEHECAKKLIDKTKAKDCLERINGVKEKYIKAQSAFNAALIAYDTNTTKKLDLKSGTFTTPPFNPSLVTRVEKAYQDIDDLYKKCSSYLDGLSYIAARRLDSSEHDAFSLFVIKPQLPGFKNPFIRVKKELINRPGLSHIAPPEDLRD